MLRQLLLAILIVASAAARAQPAEGLRGRALFLEIERAKSLPGAERAAALVSTARAASEPSRSLADALDEARSNASGPAAETLIEAAKIRLSAMRSPEGIAGEIRLVEHSMYALHGDSAILARELIADAAAFAGMGSESSRWRAAIEGELSGQAPGSAARIRNLDELTRISNEPEHVDAYTGLLRSGTLDEQDRIHVLSRLLINLCRLNRTTSIRDPWLALQAALETPPARYDSAEAALAAALFYEASGRPAQAAGWYARIPHYRRTASVTEGLIAIADFYSRQLRRDSAELYFRMARPGNAPLETAGITYLYQQAWMAHLARAGQSASVPFLQRQLLTRDSLHRSELQASTRELQLRYDLLESLAKTRAAADEQQVEKFRHEQEQQRSILTIAVLAMLLLIAGGIAAFLYQRRRAAARLHAAELQLRDREHRAKMMTELAAAGEAERGAIAGQLHDEIGTMLSVARMNLSAAGDPEHLRTAGKLLGDVAQTVREMSHRLMPVALQQYGFRQAVEQLATDINAAGALRVELAVVGFEASRFNDLFYSTCYRMVQELLQNVLKHAGAKHALLQLVEHPDTLSLMVEDNGRGMPARRDGAGLRLLASRVSFLAGSLHIESAEGAGTTVIIELPVHPAFLKANEHAPTGTGLYRG